MSDDRATTNVNAPKTYGAIKRELIKRGVGWSKIDQMDASQMSALEAAMRTQNIRFTRLDENGDDGEYGGGEYYIPDELKDLP